MSRDGSGTYDRIHDWQADADAGIPITASRMDAEDDSIATALTNSIAKDGQTVPTADLPMGGFKHTNVAVAAARNQYPATSQVQDGAFNYAVATGSSNAYLLAPSPAITAYAAGQVFYFKANHTNTGASTLNVSSVGAKAIQHRDGTAMASGELVNNEVYAVVYDGTQFRLLSFPLTDASTTTKGIVELATNAETETGTDTARAITPAGGEATYLKQSNNLSDVDTAATAATNLGLGTGDSPQFTAVNIGDASDTTLSRASAGDLNVEGNLIYRAGGTDVPVTDGGTGSSSAPGARTNLGLGSAATRDTGVATADELPDRADADARYAQLAAANTFTDVQTISSTAPILRLEDTDALTDRKLWRITVAGGNLSVDTLTDAGVPGNAAISVSRVGTSVTGIGLNAPVTVGSSGTTIQKILSATATLDFPSTAAQSNSTLTMTVTGAAVGDSVIITGAADLVFSARVSSADTVTVAYHNYTSGAVNPGSATYRATVLQF